MNDTINKFIINLSRSIGLRNLYFADHPFLKESCQTILNDLQHILAEEALDLLFVGVIEGKLVYQGQYLVGPSIMGQQLIAFAGKLKCGGFSFGKSTTQEELDRFLELVIDIKGGLATLQEARKLLIERGIEHIELASHYTAPSTLLAEDTLDTWQGKSTGSVLNSPILIYQALFDVVAMAHGNVSLDREIDIDGAHSVSEHLLQSTRSGFADILQFVHYPDHDRYTVGHSVRVATLAVFVGNHLPLNDEQLLDLGTAALIHDIGKSKIPSEILFKPARLDKEEFAIMREHASIGAKILLDHKDASRLQIAASWGHHIRYDRGGYPSYPAWAVRSPLVALLQICDVFEALTAVRPYKAPMTPLKAYSIMLADTGAFDPALMNAFVRTMGLFPPGNRVRLSDGRQGVVVHTGTQIDKPCVRICTDPEGRPQDTDNQEIIDLSAQGPNTPAPLTITALLNDDGE